MKKVLRCCLILIIVLFLINSKKVQAKEYDVALFWGQSNMRGSAGNYAEEKKKDTRDISSFIDKDIKANYKAMNYVSTNVKSGTAYEYKINSKGEGYFSQITKDTKTLGQNLTYKNGKLSIYNKKKDKYFSIQSSAGTNMIPEFCRTYYELTGRNLVVVFCANSGEPIQNFLPHGKENKDSQYIYEAIKTKYQGAINCIKKYNNTIGKQFYIVFQGESDSFNNERSSKYYSNFMKVHKNLKKDLGLSLGAICQTGRNPKEITNKNIKKYTKVVNNAHMKLAKENSDIIIGSTFGYDNWIKNNTKAFCKKYKTADNRIHFTSASLSQIGRNVATEISKKIYKLNYKTSPTVSVYADSNRTNVYYTFKDQSGIKDYSITNEKGKAIIKGTRNLKKVTSINEKIKSLVLSKGKLLSCVAEVNNILGHQSKSKFTIERKSNGKYYTNNSPIIQNVYLAENKKAVYIYFKDGNGIYDAYIKDINKNTWNKKTLSNVISNSTPTAKIKVNLNEMKRENNNYSIDIRIRDTSSKRLETTQKIEISLKNNN